EVFLRLALYRRRGTHRHERRRFNHAVRSRQSPETRTRRIGRQNFEAEIHAEECIRKGCASSRAQPFPESCLSALLETKCDCSRFFPAFGSLEIAADPAPCR